MWLPGFGIREFKYSMIHHIRKCHILLSFVSFLITWTGLNNSFAGENKASYGLSFSLREQTICQPEIPKPHPKVIITL